MASPGQQAAVGGAQAGVVVGWGPAVEAAAAWNPVWRREDAPTAPGGGFLL